MFEYQMHHLSDSNHFDHQRNLEMDMNKMAKDGWRVVSTTNDPRFYGIFITYEREYKVYENKRDISEERDILLKEKEDRFVYYKCVSKYCPRIVKEEKNGGRTLAVEDCFGSEFLGCNVCSFEGSDMCEDCIHSEEE